MAGLKAPLHLELPVHKVVRYGSDYTCLSFIEPDLSKLCEPGNFFELKATGNNQERRLYKPISVFGARDGELSFLIKNAGPGSGALCDMHPGSMALLTGPLGNTFPLDEIGNIVLVSGGVGYPPLAYLKEHLQEARSVVHIHGGACVSDIFPCDIQCTIDGSAGINGLVTDGLAAHIRYHSVDLICSCGPLPMLEAVQAVAFDHGIRHFASLEAYMACGIGVCHGCSIPYGNTGAYSRVCKEGPVFDAWQIRWEEI